jgi:SAM-dependent methyltransferase
MSCTADLLSASAINRSRSSSHYHNLQLAAALFIDEAVTALGSGPSPENFPENFPEAHHRKFYEWMKHQATNLHAGSITCQDDTWDSYLRDDKLRASLVHDVMTSSPYGELIVRVGKSLISILRGDVHPFSIMFNDDLMDRLYKEELLEAGQIPSNLVAYLELLGHDSSHAGLRILEVGAGTGSTTHYPLETLCPVDADGQLADSKIAEYTFTDVSPSFFEKAKVKFKKWQDMMTFKQLDIETEPTFQGFEPGSYDVIMVSSVSADDLCF